MCLIVHRPTSRKRKRRGSHVPNNVITYNARMNPDGFGIAWRGPGGMQYTKFGPGADGFAAFEETLKRIDLDPSIEYVAHFRKATHGPACERLSHPFVYRDPSEGTVLVFHNGIINGLSIPQGESDTSAFVKQVLAQMGSRWWTNKGTRKAVEMAVGWSRLLIMTERETIRLNQEDWKQQGGLWYSTTPIWVSATTSSIERSYGAYVGSSGQRYTKDDLIGGEDDLLPDGDELTIEGVSDVKTLVPVSTWYQNGHAITPLTRDRDDEGDDYGTAVCEVCRTLGEYYKIEGKVYLDLAHHDYLGESPDQGAGE